MKSKKHLSRLAELPCRICQRPAEIHHIRHPAITGGSQRASDWFAIPLCPDCHRGGGGFHGLGREAWERAHGSQFHHLAETLHRLYG